MIRTAFTLTGALAALAFSAATAHADPDAPTPIGQEFDIVSDVGHPWMQGILGHQDFSVLNAPAETFEGVVRNDFDLLGDENDNIVVEQDISGSIPVGEQYNDFSIDNLLTGTPSGFGEVYNSIGVTPEAFYYTPFGEFNFPTWFVEAVGPNFFEPSIFFEPLPAADLPGLAADLPTLLAGLW